jgi:hypothetical protein
MGERVRGQTGDGWTSERWIANVCRQAMVGDPQKSGRGRRRMEIMKKTGMKKRRRGRGEEVRRAGD